MTIGAPGLQAERALWHKIYNFKGLSFHKSKYRGVERPLYFASNSMCPMLSDAGQKVVEVSGYVPLPAEARSK